MSHLRMEEYKTYDERKSFAYRVGDINRFEMRLEFPAIASWSDHGLRAKLQHRLHDDVSGLLKTAEFFSLSNLIQTQGPDHFAIEYRDDEFDFRVACYQDRITLTKSGVQLETFHEWYRRALPNIEGLIKSLLSVMSKELQREQHVTSVTYFFRFITYEFTERGGELKNYEVLHRLISMVPGKNGVIAQVNEGDHEISRTDFRVNCWDVDPEHGRRLLTYVVEAPADHQYSGLWFEFGYGSATYADPDTGRREWPDPEQLLDEYDHAYALLWHRGVNGFMKSVLDQIAFKTAATYIP